MDDFGTEILENARGWLLIAAGGNVGRPGRYEDDPTSSYVWDSTVPNHAKLAAGDLIAIWDKRQLLGVSVIDEIDERPAIKTRYQCPECRSSDLYERTTMDPRYRCARCDSEFQKPREVSEEVTAYASEHASSWVDLPGLLLAQELRTLTRHPRSQHSIRLLRTPDFLAALMREGAGASLDLVAKAEATKELGGGHRKAVVRARVGQGAFRRGLIDRYGHTCAISGSQPAEALEACHLYPYAEVGEHDLDGGLLLRRDIHRLFDLGLLAVEPNDLTVDISPPLAQFADYRGYQGRQLSIDASTELRDWLARHWTFHREADPPTPGGLEESG